MPLIMFVSSSFNTYVNLPKKKYDFASIGQGIKSRPNRVRRNVNFCGTRNYEDVDGTWTPLN